MLQQAEFDRFVESYNADYSNLLTRASRGEYTCLISSFTVLKDLYDVILKLHDTLVLEFRVVPYPLTFRGSDDLLASLGISHKLLLLEEGIQGRQGTALVPAPPISHEELPEGVNGIVKIRRRPQEGHEVVPRDFICPELAQDHRLEFDVDVDLLQKLLQNLPILTREFNNQWC